MNSKPLLNLALRTGFSGLARHNAALNSSAQRAVMSYGSGIRTLVTNRHLAPGLYQGAKSAANQDLMRDRSVDPRYSFKAFSTGTGESTADDDSSARAARYHWVDKEAEELIAKAYKRHKQLSDKSQSFPPSLSVKDLEKIGTPYHYEPKDIVDKFSLNLMKFLRIFVHAFFREKYDHHAVCLETVAAVPGLVGGFHRHLRSLRRMKRDYGWINVMQEEAENERMHLLIFMQVCHPSRMERTLVVCAQGLYLLFYSTLYLVNSRAAHRLTGYLEEEAHRAYTDYLSSIDSGKLPNKPAPDIAKKYYHLADDALIRDVILHVRADEAMHRDVNHHFGNKYGAGDTDSPSGVLKEVNERN